MPAPITSSNLAAAQETHGSLLGSLQREVPGAGPADAERVIFGEAPGADEVVQRVPFVGAAGKVLEELLASVGWHRRDIRIDNVVQRRPKNNKLSNIPHAEMLLWWLDARDRLAALSQKKLVLLLGDHALRLIGKKGISNWRGSLLAVDGVMYLPMLHPAYTFRDPVGRRALDRDFQRARDWMDGKITQPQRKYVNRPTIEEVELHASLVQTLRGDDPLTIDIETPGYLACVGSSYNPHFALSIPTTRAYWKTTELVMRAWRAIRAICQSRSMKVMQHGLFDAYWLRRQARVELNNWQWDLMCMHHCLAPQEPHDLAYIASMYQDWYVFWKQEAKDPESVQRYAKSFDALTAYNCMDCCEQIGLFEPLREAMVERNLLDFYDGHYRKLMPHLLDLMCHGMRVDGPQRARRAAAAKVECIQIEDRLGVIAGRKMHAKKSLARKQLVKLLYEDLKLPKVYNRESVEPTTDVFTVQKLTNKYPKKMHEIGPLIMTHRKQEKLVGFLDPKKVDDDGRFRSSYGFDPTSGRFSSGPNPMGTGDNAQNQDRRIRDTFLADEGMVLLRVDLSQAESRIIDMLTLHPRHIDRARAQPWERDVHRETAAIVFQCSERDVTDEQRYLCKRGKYAGVYDITPDELSRQLAKEALFLSPKECARIIQRSVEEPIREWQARVRGTILRDRCIGNSWGWTFDFSGLRLDRETYKRGYAFTPQSEIGFLMHHWGFYVLAVEQRRLGCRINAHVHDELVISVRPERVYEVMGFLRASLERPRRYSAAGQLTIPCTWALGANWKGGIKWDRFPDQPAVDNAVKRVIHGEA